MDYSRICHLEIRLGSDSQSSNSISSCFNFNGPLEIQRLESRIWERDLFTHWKVDGVSYDQLSVRMTNRKRKNPLFKCPR